MFPLDLILVAFGILNQDEEEKEEVEQLDAEDARQRSEDHQLREFMIRQRQDDISERNGGIRHNGTPRRIVLPKSDKERREFELPGLPKEPGSQIKQRPRKPRK